MEVTAHKEDLKTIEEVLFYVQKPFHQDIISGWQFIIDKM